MGMFGALDAASSGASLGRVWMDVIADNVANVNTVRPAGEEPFRAAKVVAQSQDGLAGVRVRDLVLTGGDPEVTYDPDNPLADGQGYVTRPKVDLSEEMTNMLIANRMYAANLSVMQQAKDSYQAALQIGRG
jgi:flagellar basal-body rod protein FlgC